MKLVYYESMTEDSRQRLERIESLLEQRRQIENELESVLNPVKPASRKREKPVIPSIHTFIESILRERPEGMTTQEVYAEMLARHPEMSVRKNDTTLSLVYLAHKRQTIERIGHGAYRIRST